MCPKRAPNREIFSICMLHNASWKNAEDTADNMDLAIGRPPDPEQRNNYKFVGNGWSWIGSAGRAIWKWKRKRKERVRGKAADV